MPGDDRALPGQQVLVLLGVGEVGHLADAGLLGAVGHRPGLFPPDLAQGGVGGQRAGIEGQAAAHAGGEDERVQEVGRHRHPGPLGDPQHLRPGRVVAEPVPALGHRHRPGVGEVRPRALAGAHDGGGVEGVTHQGGELGLAEPGPRPEPGQAEGLGEAGHVPAEHFGSAGKAPPGGAHRPGDRF